MMSRCCWTLLGFDWVQIGSTVFVCFFTEFYWVFPGPDWDLVSGLAGLLGSERDGHLAGGFRSSEASRSETAREKKNKTKQKKTKKKQQKETGGGRNKSAGKKDAASGFRVGTVSLSGAVFFYLKKFIFFFN